MFVVLVQGHFVEFKLSSPLQQLLDRIEIVGCPIQNVRHVVLYKLHVGLESILLLFDF